MALPENKTKIVCTIGPASDGPETIGALLRAGMNVARLNFSHGDFAGHGEVVGRLRAASRADLVSGVTGRARIRSGSSVGASSCWRFRPKADPSFCR